MATDKPRFSLTMDESLLNRVENYQLKHKISTKSKAIQALVEVGLRDLNQPSAALNAKENLTLNDEDEELLRLYHQLDHDDRLTIKGEIRGLLLTEKYQSSEKNQAI